MSTCWKCGRELPPGQVECEDGCGEPRSRGESEPCVNFNIQMPLDTAKVESDDGQREFHKSVKQFGLLIKAAMETSGLNRFMKVKDDNG